MASPAAVLRSSPAPSSPLLHRPTNKTVTRSAISTPTRFSVSDLNDTHLHYSKKQPSRIIRNVTTVAEPIIKETTECSLPTWAEFDLGIAPVFWKTINGLPPTSGEQLTLYYNPAATNLIPNEEFGVAFNGGFNQPIMCGGEPREMRRKNRGKADSPFYTIKLCIPKHAVKLVFSFTNGTEWDGPYKLKFQPLKIWRNKPYSFFNEGDRCQLDLVLGCTDPSSPSFNPLANVDDGSCPLDAESDEA